MRDPVPLAARNCESGGGRRRGRCFLKPSLCRKRSQEENSWL